MTDTSYFPTDELQAVPDQPQGADASGAQKDLAFLGCVYWPDLPRGILLTFHLLVILSSGFPSTVRLSKCKFVLLLAISAPGWEYTLLVHDEEISN